MDGTQQRISRNSWRRPGFYEDELNSMEKSWILKGGRNCWRSCYSKEMDLEFLGQRIGGGLREGSDFLWNELEFLKIWMELNREGN